METNLVHMISELESLVVDVLQSKGQSAHIQRGEGQILNMPNLWSADKRQVGQQLWPLTVQSLLVLWQI